MYGTDVAKLNGLVGHAVESIYVGEGEHDLYLFLDDNRVFVASTMGDCCSETWWADILGVRQLLGQPIRKAEEIPMPEPDDDRTRQEYDQAYCLRLTTSHGVCDFIFRNSSNGYYGGWANYGYESEQPPKNEWTKVEENWSA